jgi:hypothetical protein
MTKEQFIVDVIEELTEGRKIPLSPKADRIESIMKKVYKKFTEMDNECVEMEYALLQKDLLETSLFRQRRQILMPSCVEAVEEVKELGGNYLLNYTPDRDFRKVYSSINLALAIAGNSDNMLTAVTNGFYNDMLRNFIIRTVAFHYNPHTHCITIRGRDNLPESLVAICWVHIPLEAMCGMDRFFEYVCGKCRISWTNVFGFVDAKQIGGYALNLAKIAEQGQKAIDDVEAYWKESREEDVAFIEEW